MRYDWNGCGWGVYDFVYGWIYLNVLVVGEICVGYFGGEVIVSGRRNICEWFMKMVEFCVIFDGDCWMREYILVNYLFVIVCEFLVDFCVCEVGGFEMGDFDVGGEIFVVGEYLFV